MRCRPLTTVPCCVALALALALAVPCAAIAQSDGGAITSAPPAQYRPALVGNTAAVAVHLTVGAPARLIELAAPAITEMARFKAGNAARGAQGRRLSSKALAIGFSRDTPESARGIALSALTWVAAGDGGRVARIEVRSPDAAALRVALRVAPTAADVTLQFAGADGKIFGPVPLRDVAQDTLRFGEFWSPVMEGDSAIIELHAGRDVAVEGVVLDLPRVAHQVVAIGALRELAGNAASANSVSNSFTKTLSEIGLAQSCNIDVACVAPTTALSNAAKAVAQLLFVGDDDNHYVCTGTLLNDIPATNTPYLFTAAHCMGSAKSAHSLNTFWFFDAVACKDNAVPPYVQLTGGAALLGRSQDRDWALVRLNEPPPAGVWFAGWSAAPVPLNAVTATLHHPRGDLKKWSAGYVSQVVNLSDFVVHGAFNEVAYTSGITEGGSSGAALLTYLDSGDYYEVRGGISEGNLVTCPAAPGVTYDDYSRVEDMLPLVRQYLTPFAPNPKAEVAAVEFYNKLLDHYFLTADQAEINDLDTGVKAGWERTGLRFLVHVKPTVGASPVCRFYRAPAYGDSHFYSASPAECAATKAAHPLDWTLESSAVFYVRLPEAKTGACPADTQPMWRFFNKVTINHRYTVEQVIRDEMRAQPSTWVAEGYGTDSTVMCAPVK
jgi:lysyl endopeptidase